VTESTLGSNVIFLSGDDQKNMNVDFVDGLVSNPALQFDVEVL
jgi:hypothetical protein